MIRNDQLLLDQSEKTTEVEVKKSKYGAIRSFLMSPVGILIWSVVIGFKGMFLYRNVFLMDKSVVKGTE